MEGTWEIEQFLGCSCWVTGSPYTTFLLPLVYALTGGDYSYAAGILLFATWILILEVNSDWLTSCFWPPQGSDESFQLTCSHLSLPGFREIQNSNTYVFLKIGAVGRWTFCYNSLLRIYYVAFFFRSFTDLEVINVGLTKPWRKSWGSVIIVSR